MERMAGGWTTELKGRVVSVFWGLVFLFLILSVRMFYLQYLERDWYYAKARNQQQSDIILHARRGEIRDRNGLALATSVARQSVCVDPTQVSDIGATARVLGHILKTDPAHLSGVIRRGGTFQWIQRKAPEKAVAEIDQLLKQGRLPGVFFQMEETGRRFYPKGRLAAHLLGATGIDDQGLDGIEAAHEEVLGGTPGRVRAAVDKDGWRIPTENAVVQGVKPGKHLVLTLDETIQYIAERELARQVKEFKAKGGICLVMDVRTAEVLALAIQPDFPADRFAEVDPALRRNRAITDPYEPGSTFKVFLAGAALQAGVQPSSMFHCPGNLVVDGWTIHNANDGLVSGGTESLTDIIAYSFNTGTASVALSIGRENLGRGLEAFGFGHPTGIGLQGEEPGILSDYHDWAAIETATISFGQGVAVTPLQLVSGMQAVANGGVRMRPRIVKQIMDDQGRVLQSSAPEELGRPLTPEAARHLRDILENVCTRGTGKNARVPGYLVAGKTGTAQVVENGVYSSGRFIASFLGFAPARDPRLVMLVKIEEPGTVYWGGVAAAPVFSRVAGQALWKMGVRPTPGLVQKAENE